ncbi:Hypothetical protein PBC10988_16270 [Planctomycetales bacterium 10988]|nr:Hypothetical protein PBC10988_16270 [Planctomycetales bacterium 10988]
MASSATAVSPEVKEANEKMKEAWELGRDLLDQLGMKANYGAMKSAASGEISTAEKYRKYRSMANRITEKELEAICKMCEKENKIWGPTFLVELSRLRTSKDRRQLAKNAIREGWGLIEFKRQIRLMIGPGSVSSRVGRKRKVDWTDEAEILDELAQMCHGWTRFAAEIQVNTSTENNSGLELLTKSLRERFEEASEQILDLQQKTKTRQKRTTD